MLIKSTYFELDLKTYAMSSAIVLVSALPLACPPAYLPRPKEPKAKIGNAEFNNLKSRMFNH